MASQGNELNLSDGSPPRKKIRKSLNRRSMLPDGPLPLVENLVADDMDISASCEPQEANPSSLPPASPTAASSAKISPKDPAAGVCREENNAKSEDPDFEDDIGLRCVERYEKEMQAWRELEEDYQDLLQRRLKSDNFCDGCDCPDWKTFLSDRDREKLAGKLDYENILRKADRSFKTTVCRFNDIGFQFRRKQAVIRKIELNVQNEALALRFKFLGDVTAKAV